VARFGLCAAVSLAASNVVEIAGCSSPNCCRRRVPGALAVFYDRYERAIVRYLVRRTRDAELAAGLTAEVSPGRAHHHDAAPIRHRYRVSDALDDPDQFGSLVSVVPREVDEVAGARHDGASFGRGRVS
jgi:hypothetical protein